MAEAAVYSKDCILLLPLFVWVLCLVLVSLFRTLCPSSFAFIFMGKRELVAIAVNCVPCVL